VKSHHEIKPLSIGDIVKPPSMWKRSMIVLNATASAVLGLGLTLLPSMLHAQNIITTVVGGGQVPADPLAADIPGPTAAIRDSHGNTFIAAPLSTTIFQLSSGDVFSVYAGQGYGGYRGDGGPASAALLGRPTGLTFDSLGNIYIADIGNSRIREINISTNTITTVAGSGVKCANPLTACGDGASATAAELNFPEAVAVDGAGNIYIADAFDNKIRVVNMQNSAVTLFGQNIQPGNIATVVGSGNTCSSSTSPCGDGAAAIKADLNFPQGVALDGSGNLYVSDTKDNRVRIVAAGGTTITAFAGTGAACPNPASSCGDGGAAASANFRKPQGLAFDGQGDLYIADTNDNKIRVVTASIVSTVAGTGRSGFSGDGGAPTLAQVDLPSGVFVDASGEVVISDSGNQRVRLVSSGASPVINTIAGGGSGGDNGSVLSATLADPYNVAEDAAGSIYVADLGNNRIRKITNPSGGNATITTVVGTGSLGYTGDGPITSAALNAPTDVVVDSLGNIWIADDGNGVVRVANPSASSVTVVGVTIPAGEIATVAGSGNPCSPSTGNCGDTGKAVKASITSPHSIALDSAGNLYLSDYYANRVREVAAATGIISTIAGNGDPGSLGVPGPATKAYLHKPDGIAVDSLGNVYISDSGNSRVLIVNTSGTIANFALNGRDGCKGDGGPALDASMWNPLELALDPSGDLFIGGGNDSVVRRVDAATLTIGTVAGSCKESEGGFRGDRGLATQALLANVGLSIDGQQNLFIADAGNNRIRYVHLTPAATVPSRPYGFGEQVLYTTSSPRAVPLTSSGGVDLNLTSISITGTDPGDFAQTNNCGSLPVLLGVDVSCTINVTFTPQALGPRKATLMITDNASNSPQTISLAGAGIE